MQYATSARGLDDDVAKNIAVRVQYLQLLYTSTTSTIVSGFSTLLAQKDLERKQGYSYSLFCRQYVVMYFRSSFSLDIGLSKMRNGGKDYQNGLERKSQLSLKKT